MPARMLWVGVGAFCVALVVPLPTPVALGCFKKPAPEAPCVGVKALRVALVAPYLAPAASGCYIRLVARDSARGFRLIGRCPFLQSALWDGTGVA